MWRTVCDFYICFSFFFFQAEDGIRDYKVTGVQTCALPIFDVGAPEFQKAPQHGIIRRQVEFLPDEALEQGRVVRQPIDDFCGSEPVPLKLQLEGGHVSLVRSLSCTEETTPYH